MRNPKGVKASWQAVNTFSNLGIEAANDSHRKAWSFANDSINPDGWKSGQEYLTRTSADICLTQEVKVPDGEPRAAAEQRVRNSKRDTSILPCVVSSCSGKPAGVAVSVRLHTGMAEAVPLKAAEHLLQPGRFTMKVVNAICRGGVNCGSVYLNHSVGADARLNRDLLEAIHPGLRLLSGPWLIGGDWNETPAALAATEWLKLVGGTVVDRRAIITSMTALLCPASLCMGWRGCGLSRTGGCTPRSPVRLALLARSKFAVVRQIKSSASLPAVLLHGPSTKATADGEVDIEGLGVGEACPVVMKTSDSTCNYQLLGHEPGVGETSRADGPSNVEKEAKFQTTEPLDTANPLAKAWHVLARWLRTVVKSNVPRARQAGGYLANLVY